MSIYGVSVPVTTLLNPKTKEEVVVNTSDAQDWIKQGYVAVGGTVTSAPIIASTKAKAETAKGTK